MYTSGGTNKRRRHDLCAKLLSAVESAKHRREGTPLKFVATFAVALAAASLSTAPARAAIVTYDIAGPLSGLAGQNAAGSMRFDNVRNPGDPDYRPLMALSFDFDGVQYDQTNVFNAVFVDQIDPADVRVVFGTGCGDSGFGISCVAGVGSANWYAYFIFGPYEFTSLTYWVPGARGLSEDALRVTPRTGSVPVPGTLPLLAAAGLAALALRRRQS
jgi:hypothetical protein